ncbi:MAG: isoprenylcysteine carboxylmethyltransferase family protein [Candidatus Aminicenantes bacterium]|nr:isoprenylcysteine carboxylmethyltransferase family protein [Candidatus Aminicenantes bacterium]
MAEDKSETRIAPRFIFFLLLQAGFFFLPAGTLNWPEAWIWLAIFLIYGVAIIIWMKKYDPELFRERSRIKIPKRKWDKLIGVGLAVFFIPVYVIPGFDAVRYGWSHVPVPVEIIGFLCFVVSVAWVARVAKENTYLSRIVEIQKERGHKVITTGPYRFVRHPMYLGSIVYIISIPLALGSLYALIPSALCAILLIIRTRFEEKTLHSELEGYPEYARKTRFRLFPGIW